MVGDMEKDKQGSVVMRGSPHFSPPTRETLHTSSPVRAEVDMLHHAQLQVAVL